MRYLGAGGLFVGWRGHAILTGPFFSNPGFLEIAFGRNRPDEEAIRRGLEGLPLDRVGALLFGHSHHDHLADALAVARLAGNARLYLNRTGARALTAELPRRLTVLEDTHGRPVQLVDAAGEPLPFRLRAVRSGHAPHVGPITFMDGEGGCCDAAFEERRYWSFKEGQSYALILELTDGDDLASPVRYRLLYQDAASREPVLHLPPADGGYDLVVTCMASAHRADGYPEDVLALTGARHVLITHYESFFVEWGPGHRFVPLLTDGRADAFLDRVGCGLEA
ncbi:MAG TPA: MBL fold metallo-hydrolase, partial [Thermoanaerobaculia bacterium]|nr:MBL fold metallo-hydrolase [Thermoanaerobaculia bacterium]